MAVPVREAGIAVDTSRALTSPPDLGDTAAEASPSLMLPLAPSLLSVWIWLAWAAIEAAAWMAAAARGVCWCRSAGKGGGPRGLAPPEVRPMGRNWLAPAAERNAGGMYMSI
jgi:hypothetical protein